MLTNGVPIVVEVMLLMPVTYWLSNALFMNTAKLHGVPAPDQPRRKSVRLVAVPILNAGFGTHEPCTYESELQRVAPR